MLYLFICIYFKIFSTKSFVIKDIDFILIGLSLSLDSLIIFIIFIIFVKINFVDLFMLKIKVNYYIIKLII